MKKITKSVLSVFLCILLIMPFAAMNASALKPVAKKNTVHVGPSGMRTVAQFPQDILTRKTSPSHGWSAKHQRSNFGDGAWIFRNQLTDFEKVMYDAFVASKAGLIGEDADIEYDDEPGVIYHYRAVPIDLTGYEYEVTTDDEIEELTNTLLYDTVASMSAFMEDYPEFFWLWGFDFDFDFIPNYATDDNGDIIYEVDDEGNPIVDYVYDEDGNPVIQLDDDNNPVYEVDDEGNLIYEVDDEGNQILDEDNNPIPIPVYVTAPVPVVESATLSEFTMYLAHADANTLDGETYGETPYESWDDVQTAYDNLMAGVASVTVEGENRYEKLKSIHDWICTVADYDYTFILPHAYDPYGIFAEPHDFVCEGYSEIFKLLCDREGIPCITIVGVGGGGDDWEGHKWNYVQMEDGKWYGVDATWDDQDNRDVDDDYIMYEYFLTGSETYDVSFGHTTFNESHIAQGAVFNFDFYLEYPELSEEMYYYDGNFEVSEDGLWRYQIIDEDEGIITITSGYYGYPAYLGEDTEIEVPAEIDGYTVVEIGTSAFYGMEDITSITLPDTVDSIYRFAFENCTGLESIEIPEGLASISYGAFTNCSALTELVLPESLEWLGSYVFYGCDSLETITILSKNIDEEIGFGNFTFDIALAAIYGYSDTYTEQYCNEAGIRFIPLDEEGNPTEELYKGFPDVSDDAWYAEAVRYNAARGYITGYKNGKFGPADTLQRQDFIVILARISGVDFSAFDDVECTLSDVAKGSYYEAAVKWAVENEIIKGYENGKFGVGDAITREQVATILYRYMGSPTVSRMTMTLKPFADKDKISSFAKNAMVWAIQNGVISGKNETTLAPTATASRAEIATIVMRMNKQAMFGYPGIYSA